METREELLEQIVEWTGRYMEADNRLQDLLPLVKDLSKDEKFTFWVPTKETLVAFEKAEKAMNRALLKLRKIMEKLYKLR